MKAKELMIGDWVNIPQANVGIRKIDVGDISFFTEFEPIRLTPEILEKNRFERRGCMSSHKSNIGLIIHHWNDDLCFLNYSEEDIPPIMIPFHYVHELQRALRCCGLWELADNFKV